MAAKKAAESSEAPPAVEVAPGVEETAEAPAAAKPAKSAKPAKPAKAKLEKTAFILGLPSDTPINDVIEKGKAVGLTMVPNYISSVRSKNKAKGKTSATKKAPTKKSAAKNAPAKKRAAKKVVAAKPSKVSAKRGARRGKLPEKAEFILTFPQTTSVKDILATAKVQRIKLSENYIYKVRRDAGLTGKKKATTAGKSAKKAGKSTGPAAAVTTTSSKDLDKTFRQMVAQIGVVRALELVEQARKKIEDI